MQTNEEQLKKFILEEGLVSKADLDDAFKKAETKKQKVGDILLSDGKISESKFEGLHLKVTHNNPVEDLWLLSKTDTIIGADSSFAIMASLLGDKLFIVFKRGITWDYYKDKKGFFVNKYVERFIY